MRDRKKEFKIRKKVRESEKPCFGSSTVEDTCSSSMCSSVSNVVCWGMVLGVIISKVVCAFIPVESELTLCLATA